MSACSARRQSDEMACSKCRLRWDVDDPEPPLCGLLVATRLETERLENAVGYVSDLQAGFVSGLAPDIFTVSKR